MKSLGELIQDYAHAWADCLLASEIGHAEDWERETRRVEHAKLLVNERLVHMHLDPIH